MRSETSSGKTLRRVLYCGVFFRFTNRTRVQLWCLFVFRVFLRAQRHISTPYRRKFRAITFNWKRTMPSDSVCNRYRSVPQYTKSGVFNWAPPPRKNLRNSSLRLPVNTFNENVNLFKIFQDYILVCVCVYKVYGGRSKLCSVWSNSNPDSFRRNSLIAASGKCKICHPIFFFLLLIFFPSAICTKTLFFKYDNSLILILI